MSTYNIKINDRKIGAIFKAKLVPSNQGLVIKVPVQGAPEGVVGSNDYCLDPTGAYYRMAIGWRNIEWLRETYSLLIEFTRKVPFSTFQIQFHRGKLSEVLGWLVEDKIYRVVKPEEIEYCLSTQKVSDIRADFEVVGREFPTFYINIFDVEGISDAQNEERLFSKVASWLFKVHRKVRVQVQNLKRE